MKSINLSALVVILIILVTTTSFTDKSSPDKILPGIYGICSNEDASAPRMELIINEDLTFHYFNNFQKDKTIDIKGKWSANGSTIYLSDYNSDIVINDKWTFDKNENCIRSRKGLEWTRLCHIK